MLDELPKLIPRNQPYHPLHRKDGIGLPFLPVVRGVVVRIKRIASRNLLATPTVSPLIIFHNPITGLQRYGVALLDSDLDSAAMEIAVHYDRVPLDDDELEERVANAGLAADLRGASLRALAAPIWEQFEPMFGADLIRAIRNFEQRAVA